MEIINIENQSGDANISGTSLMGYIKTNYSDLVKCFGEPDLHRGDKTTCEWHIEFTVVDEYADEIPITATIYDWKLDDTPYGEYDWHIGGHGHDAVELVHQAMAPVGKKFTEKEVA